MIRTIMAIFQSIIPPETAQKARDYSEDMTLEMLAMTVGLPDDPT
jgi:hypothetical protein